MAFVAAAVCPHPPMLVPGLSGPADQLADLRRASLAAVDEVLAARPDVVYVVGSDALPRAKSFAPWGVGVSLAVDADVPEPLPLSLLVGAWLTKGQLRSFVAVDEGLGPADCSALGAELAASAPAVAFVVMGDGSARRDVKAPGYVDPRAEGFDRGVVDALSAGDPDALLDVDAALASELLASGRAPWQVLAGAVAGGPVRSRVTCECAPYGVGYVVAVWSR